MSASLLLFSRLKGKLETTAEVRIRSLKVSFSLVLHSAVQLKIHKPNNPELLPSAERKVNETLNGLYQYLKEWVGSYAIFGPSFGYPVLRSARGELEVHILDFVYNVPLCNHYCYWVSFLQMWESILRADCPDKMASEWHGIVRKIVTERVERVVSVNL